MLSIRNLLALIALCILLTCISSSSQIEARRFTVDHPLQQKIRHHGHNSHPRSSITKDPSYILENANFSGIARFNWPTKNISWGKNFGYLDEQFKIPLPSEPKYPVASNTKNYISISLWQLHEKGIIKSMNDNIADYLTPQDFQDMGLGNQTKLCPKLQSDPSASGCQVIRFRDLLGMSSGLPNQGLQWLPWPGSNAVVCGWHINKPLLFVPGSPSTLNPKFRNYYYSNAGFECAAYFVEKLSGMKLNDYLTKNIYSVVGLKNTYYDPYNGKFKLDPERVNEFYQFINSEDPTELLGLGKASSEFDLGTAGGAGGIVSTSEDEARLYRHLFSNFSASAPSNGVLSYSSLMEIVTPWSYINNDYFYGSGLFLIAPENKENWPTDYGNGRIPMTVPPTIVIEYEGEIMASHTANVFDLRYAPPVMAQVWSSVIVFYPTKQQYEEVQVSRNENFFEAAGKFQPQAGLTDLAFDLITFFAGPPPKN